MAGVVGVAVLAGVVALRSGRARMRRALAAAPPTPQPEVQPATIAGLALLDDHRAAYFGDRWDVPATEHAVRVPTPVGQPCGLCGEPIHDGDRGWMRGAMREGDDGRLAAVVVPHHAECELRTITGHLWGVCGCHGFDTSHASALELWRRIHGHEPTPARKGNDHG